MPDDGSMLERMVKAMIAEVECRKGRVPEREIIRRVHENPAAVSFESVIRRAGFAVIAEFKRAPPSKGFIAREASPAETAQAYQVAGATALSVLTNSEFFHGSDDDLSAIKKTTTIPVLRKDFTVSSYQIYEARAIGADAILLIVAALDERQLKDFLALARTVGLSVIVETHSEGEIERACAAGARIIGINNRDLQTFETTIQTTLSLAPLVPEDITVISESGIHSGKDAALLRQAGVHGILVGESLMRAAQVSQDNLVRHMHELFGRSESRT